jgi:Asp-tRNA(Asn)/Glu-tRNA(Gln) amidotransferase A subunit family amidase
VVEPPPISGLAKPDADWCEGHDDQVEEGAHCRDQHDEEDTLENDCWHMALFREYETAQAEFQPAEVASDALNPAVEMARKLARVRMTVSSCLAPARRQREFQRSTSTPALMTDTTYDRRAFMAYFSSIGLGATLFPGVLWGQAQQQPQAPEITKEMIASAEQIAGLSFSDDERTAMVRNLQQMRGNITTLHKEPLDQSVLPAIVFDPVPPGRTLPKKTQAPIVRTRVPVMSRPGSLDELAYATVNELSELVRSRKVKPSELTDMYLSRLKRYDPQLHCVVNLTEERARKQALDLDAEIARGKYRGPLHGIPWGAKDLLAVKGYPTTWGAGLYENQAFDYESPVVTRLDAAGAILIAKLTLGSLAQGDRWWKERTRNPWNPETGSSGSSAGPASATAAGCVGFSIGSETNGSITSPARTCGLAGFRPTFGRVPRTGAMALSWTTDKLGPICRSAEDCAIVFDAIQGPDGVDYSVKAYPFNWNATAKISQLKIAYFKDDFDRRAQDGTITPIPEAMNFLKVLESLGARPEPIEAPAPNYGYLDNIILNAECGAAFEPDTLNARIKELESYSSWPNTFRGAQFIPAVDYVNANRVRIRAMEQTWELFSKYDVIVTPRENTSVTNIVGTPSIVVPTGFAIPQQTGRGGGRGRGGPPTGAGGRGGDTTRAVNAPPPPTIPLPTGMYVMGPIFQDEKNLLVAHAFQQATDFHKKRPPQFG